MENSSKLTATVRAASEVSAPRASARANAQPKSKQGAMTESQR